MATVQERPTKPAGGTSAQRLMNRFEVAERLNVSVRTVDGLIARGELKTLRVGDRRLARPEDVESYIVAQLAKN
jgi:excisionase family DNA binding protein